MNNCPSKRLMASSAGARSAYSTNAKSARAAGFPVEGADNLSRLTDLRKVCAEVVFGGLIRQVADEQSD